MLRNRQACTRSQRQRLPHDDVREHGLAIVGETHRALLSKRDEVCEFAAHAANGRGGHGKHARGGLPLW